MPLLVDMIHKNELIRELYLHNNSIKGDGANLLLKSLYKHETLKVLDLSWNIIGSGCSTIGETFLQLFARNQVIVHCDFSFNKISAKATT